MEYDKKKPDDDIEDTGKDDIFSFILPARIFFFLSFIFYIFQELEDRQLDPDPYSIYGSGSSK